MCREHLNGCFTMHQAVMHKATRGRGYKARVMMHGFTVKEKGWITSAYYRLNNFSNEQDTSLPTTEITSTYFDSLSLQFSESTNVTSWMPSDAYIHNYTGSSLVQIMACRLLRLSYYPSQLWHIVSESLGTHFTESWIKIQQFPRKNMRDYMNTKISPARCRPSCLVLVVLNKDVY